MSTPKLFKLLPTQTSDWATYVCVGLSVISTLSTSSNMPLWQTLLFLALTVPYTILIVVAPTFCERLHSRALLLAYFIAMSFLGSLIFYLSEGTAWLMALPVAAQSAYYFSWVGTFLLNLVIFSEMMVAIRFLSGEWSATLQSGVSLVAAQVFVVIFTRIAAQEERGRIEVERLATELGQANQQLREYAAQVEEVAILRERNRLARDIHDSLGHYLTALNMQLKAAEAVLPADVARAQDALGKAQSLAQDALSSVRQSVGTLRDEPALQQPLPDALGLLLAACREAGLVADLQVEGEVRGLPAPLTITLYRAVQEALTNVRKHALASRVKVTLDYRADCVRLVVSDNGVGARDISEGQAGFGLLGLRERVALLGGKVNLLTAPQQGFTLEVEINTCEHAEPV